MKTFSVLPLALMLVVLGVQSKTIHSSESDALNEAERHAALAVEQHAIAKRSLDYFWQALKSLGSPTKANVTTVKPEPSNSIETDLKKIMTHGPFKRDVQRHKRSLHELHKLLKDQNDQLQRLLRTLPGGSLLSPVVTHGSQPPHGIFNPIPLTNTLFFVNHDGTTQKPKDVSTTLSAADAVTQASSTVAPQPSSPSSGPVEAISSTTEPAGIDPKKGPAPSGSTTSATAASSASTETTTEGASRAPREVDVSTTSVPESSSSTSAEPSEHEASSSTAAATLESEGSSTSVAGTSTPAAPSTTAEDISARQGVPSSVAPVGTSSVSPTEVTTDDGSGALDDTHTDTNDAQIDIL